MATVVPYEIIVPSRRRTENMRRIQALLPTARICVDEREEADYAPVVAAGRLLLHAPTATMGQLRQWILDNCAAECVVMVDDDFEAVVCMAGWHPRKMTDPGAILQVIENTVNMAADLGIGLFSWNRIANPMLFMGTAPFSLVAPASNAWGVIGRDIRLDETRIACEDVDLTLAHLLKKRIVLHDRRFYFDCGRIWGGAGGLQGIRTGDGQAAEKALMRRKWGCYLVTKPKIGGTTGMSIRVERRSPLASYR